MKVWIVNAHNKFGHYDSHQIVEVFDSEDKARDYCKKENDINIHFDYKYEEKDVK